MDDDVVLVDVVAFEEFATPELITPAVTALGGNSKDDELALLHWYALDFRCRT